jgi:hypothetical protein
MYTGNGVQGITILGGTGIGAVQTPAGILATRAVETKAGWVGQIVLDKEIIWESDAMSDDDDDEPNAETGQRKAMKATNERVMVRLRKIFA